MTFGPVAINRLVCKNTRTRLTRLGLLSNDNCFAWLEKTMRIVVLPNARSYSEGMLPLQLEEDYPHEI